MVVYFLLDRRHAAPCTIAKHYCKKDQRPVPLYNTIAIKTSTPTRRSTDITLKLLDGLILKTMLPSIELFTVLLM